MAIQDVEPSTRRCSSRFSCKPQLGVLRAAALAEATVFAAAELRSGKRKLRSCPMIREQQESMQRYSRLQVQIDQATCRKKGFRWLASINHDQHNLGSEMQSINGKRIVGAIYEAARQS
jgi:hypothetical protein